MDDYKELQTSSQTHDDHTYYESLATPGTSTQLSENEANESQNDAKDENELSKTSLQLGKVKRDLYFNFLFDNYH